MWMKIVLSVGIAACTYAAPQFDEVQRPMPYSFGYGVNVADTQDVKEHRESTSETGRTEGMYRWLQPNGLYRVVRYYVDGDSGFQAQVSEEPGPDVENYNTNDLQGAGTGIAGQPLRQAAQTSSQGVRRNQVDLRGQNQFALQQQQQQQQQLIQQQQQVAQEQGLNFPEVNQQRFTSSSNRQSASSQQSSSNQQQFNRASNAAFNRQQQNSFSNQQSFSQQQNFQKSLSSNAVAREQVDDQDFIDGGIIQGEIIDGGIINPEALNF